jgi:hypothetical protein
VNFFEISYDQWETKQFAWAMGFGPLDEPMPFLDPVHLQQYREFWNVNPRPPGLIIEDGGTRAIAWPDFLGHGGGFPAYFVSAKVIDSLKAENISFVRATPIPVASVACRRLKGVPPPKYFVLEATPGIQIDKEASVGRPAPMFRRSSWNGEQLFGRPNIWNRPSTTLLCTEKVVEIAQKTGWTNARFEKIHLI